MKSTLKSTEKPLPFGVYGREYYEGRKHKRQLVYRLGRRTEEVACALQGHVQGSLEYIVDVGTADGLMLERLHKNLPGVRLYGLDLSYQLLSAHPATEYTKLQSDALTLPFTDEKIDAIIATAVIEHVPDAEQMLRECGRILRPAGLLILTTPNPVMDHIAEAIGLLKDAGHHQTFALKDLQALVERMSFSVVEAKKFMFSPIGFPAEKTIERIFGPLGLNLVMANQLVVARKC